MSLGGYWPYYSYRRYYWYGCHPYRWYGDYPPGYVIAGDTYNYYYYNDEPRGEALEEAHRKFEQSPPAEPAEENQTDRYFDQAVKSFEAGDYTAAARKFQEAQSLAPDDIVLPFARVQALFAAGEYNSATDVLCKALAVASPDKEGVFYPRGLYSDESVLSQQIEQLSRATQLNSTDSDLKLLLGYQLLGTGKLDEAAGQLQNAALDSKNSQAATLLTNLLDKLRQPDNPKPQDAGQPDDGNAKSPPTQKHEDKDIVALAMAADNWLAVE